MDMSQEQKFDRLVRDLERSSKRQPQAYRAGVVALALLGYAYLFAIVLLLLALLGGLLGGSVWLLTHMAHFSYGMLQLGKLLIPVFVGLASLIGLIARSLRVHFDPPEGLALDRPSVPRLFAMLDEVCAALKAPRFHHVLLDGDFNAGVVQVPRLGIFGWQTNYLVLGLPLLAALSPGEFRAVLAHEVGHLSGNHGRFGAWVYRVRQTWFQLLSHLEAAQHGALSVLVPFFRWYAPYFFAYTFVLARAQEYVADRCAAEIAGAQGAGQALVATEIKGRYFAGEFWGRVFAQAGAQSEPPTELLGLLARACRTDIAGHEAERWYAQALEEQTGTDDTHPALTDRLSALGFRAVAGGPLDVSKPPLPLPAPSAETAAQTYLGAMLPRYSAAVEADWREEFATRWREEHRRAQDAVRRLEELDKASAGTALPVGDLWEQAALTAQLYGNTAAAPLLRRLVSVQPEHPQANFILGRILLDGGDPGGVPHLQAAARHDAQAREASFHAIGEFLLRQGNRAEAARYLHQARQARATPAGTPLSPPVGRH